MIDLENAREQYAALGYPHRNVLNLRCPQCRMITMVDETIRYNFLAKGGLQYERGRSFTY